MKNSGVFLCILIFCLFFSTGCEKSDDCGQIDFTPINFSNYSRLTITDNEIEDKSLIINSKTEYDRHVFIEGIDGQDFDLSTLDYNKYTLLIGKKKINGVSGTLISQRFEKDCVSNKYVYKVLVKNGGYTAMGSYIYGIIVPKNTTEITFQVELLN